MSAPPATAPIWPRAAASAVILRGDDVLLVRRGNPPRRGAWSLPGGKIEPGERARDAALREVAEETGVTAVIDGLVDVHDVIVRSDGGALEAHYVISVFFGRWLDGTPVAASDAAGARFCAIDTLATLDMTQGAQDIIAAASRLAQARRAG